MRLVNYSCADSVMTILNTLPRAHKAYTSRPGSALIVTHESNIPNKYFVRPNPFSTEISVTSPFIKKEETIYLYDINGKIVKTQSLKFNNHSASLHLDGLLAGTYYLSINGEIVKMIKQ